MFRHFSVIVAAIGFCSAQNIQKFPAPYSGFGITPGPDGALWMTPNIASPGPTIGRITTSGAFSQLPLPAGDIPGGPIVTGPDGALWMQVFSNSDTAIIRLTPSGTASQYVFDQTDGVLGMTVGPDGAIWLAETDRIGRLTTSGSYSNFPVENYYPTGIAAGADGNLWFAALNAQGNASIIGRVTPTGTMTTYPLSSIVTALAINPIAAGPDGAIWFTIFAAAGSDAPAIGRISTTGNITTYSIPSAAYDFSESSIAASPDGGLWFTGNGAVGRITTTGAATIYPLDPTAWATYAGAVPMGITAGSDAGMWFPVFGNQGIARASIGTTSAPPSVSPSSLIFSTAMGQVPASKSFQVISASGSYAYSLSVSYTSSAPVNWIDLPSLGGNVSAGTPATVTVAIANAASSLSPGAYTANINVNTGAGNSALTVAVTLNVTAPAPPQATTTTLAASPLSQTAGQPVTLTATVTPASATGTVAFFDGTSSLGSKPLVSGTATLSVSTLTIGNHTLTASYSGDTNDSASNSGPVSVTITNPNQPTILAGGILNAASYAVVNGAGASVAPGSLVAIFTSTLATQAASFTTASLPPSLSGVSVTINNVTAPVVAVVPGGASPYVSVQVPFEALPAGQTSATVPVVLTVNQVPSATVSASIVASAPGIFTIPATGQGNAVLVNLSDYSIAAPSGSIPGSNTHPIARGQSAFFYVTGLGAMTPSVPDGSGDCPAPNGLCNADQMPQVFVGGVLATQIVFAGQAPGYPGVEQINFVIPENAPTGDNVALVVVSADGTVTSNSATIAVQ